jgi:AcrR family transcriptional regulator
MAEGERTAAKEQTRKRLLDAAIERMADGDRAVNFDAIAADVGLTKGALYHHFGSVDGLVEEVYKEAIKRHAERVIDASLEGTGRERLHHIIDASATLLGSDTPFYRLLLRLHVEAGSSRTQLAPITREVQKRQRAYFTSLIAAGQADGSIRADVDAETVGMMINATLQGLLVQQLEPAKDQRHAAERFDDLLDVLL